MSRTRTRNTKVREKVRFRANRLCEICGIDVNVRGKQTDDDFPTMHHRWPRRERGLDHVENLLYICQACHSDVVHADEDVAYLMGWMAHRDQYRCTPVLTHRGWVYLEQDGSYRSLSQHEVLAQTIRHAITDKKLSA